jgi:hypothetical protein
MGTVERPSFNGVVGVGEGWSRRGREPDKSWCYRLRGDTGQRDLYVGGVVELRNGGPCIFLASTLSSWLLILDSSMLLT